MTSAVVCLHGFLGSPSNFDAVRSHLDATRAAAITTGKPHSFSCPTLTGHVSGNFAQPPLHHGFREEIARLADQIAECHVEPVTLVGYSLGGRLALGVAIERPELVRRLILVSARRGLDTLHEREERHRNDERWARLLETDRMPEFLRQWGAQPLFASLSRLPTELLERERARRLALNPAGLAWSLRKLGLGCQPSYAEATRALVVPVTLITGSLDEKFGALADGLATELPNARRIVVEGQGHALLLEAPGAIGQAIAEQ